LHHIPINIKDFESKKAIPGYLSKLIHFKNSPEVIQVFYGENNNVYNVFETIKPGNGLIVIDNMLDMDATGDVVLFFLYEETMYKQTFCKIFSKKNIL
jgi:hypothetical protein